MANIPTELESSLPSDPVAHLRVVASEYLADIERMFKHGVKVTLLVRRPGFPAQDFMLSSDTPEGAIELLERSKTRAAT